MPNLPIPNQRTWTVGETVTDVMLNSNVRDAIRFTLAPPMAIATYTGANTPVAAGHWTALPLNTVQTDTYGCLSPTGSTPSRYTAVLPGIYRVTATAGFFNNGTTFAGPFRSLMFVVNGGDLSCAKVQVPEVPNAVTSLNSTTDLFLNTGDYVEALVYDGDNTQANLDTSSGYYGRVTVAWVHR